MSDDNAMRKNETAVSARPVHLRRIFGLLLLLASLVLGIYLLAAYLGWQSGEVLRQERQQTELSNQIARQLELAEENIAQGSYNLALSRLNWVLERSPGNARALALQQQAQQALRITPTPLPPTPNTAVTATPTATPAPTPAPGEPVIPAGELQRLRQLLVEKQWAEAAAAILAFQRQFPDYERQETNRLLYDAYVNLGLELVTGKQAELGLYYFSLAENLGNLPQEAEDYRLWAGWYLQGMAYYGVNWPVAIAYFRDLCLVAPFYQSSCDLLHKARIALGDQYAFSGEWCPAQELYREANNQQRSPGLTQKLETAVINCANATPTPAAITGTLPFTQTQQFMPPIWPPTR